MRDSLTVLLPDELGRLQFTYLQDYIMGHLIHKIMQGRGMRIFPILIFVSLLTMAKPSWSDPTNCARYNYRTLDVITVNGSLNRDNCLVETVYNEHGAIYTIGPVPVGPEGISKIYRGKSGDAILEFTTKYGLEGVETDRVYGSWRRVGDEFHFQFSNGAEIYIPAF